MSGPVSHIQAAFRRDATLSAGRQQFLAVVDEPCPAHDAAAGWPCWTVPTGVCGKRIKAAFAQWPPPPLDELPAARSRVRTRRTER